MRSHFIENLDLESLPTIFSPLRLQNVTTASKDKHIPRPKRITLWTPNREPPVETPLRYATTIVGQGISPVATPKSPEVRNFPFEE